MDTKTQHVIANVPTSTEWESFIRPVCSCGWIGREVSNMYNWQLHDVDQQERNHLTAIRLHQLQGSK